MLDNPITIKGSNGVSRLRAQATAVMGRPPCPRLFSCAFEHRKRAAETHSINANLFLLFVAWPKPYQVQLLRVANDNRPCVRIYEFRPLILSVTFFVMKPRKRMQGNQGPRKERHEAVLHTMEVLMVKQERSQKRWRQMVYAWRTLKHVVNRKGSSFWVSLYQGRLSLSSMA